MKAFLFTISFSLFCSAIYGQQKIFHRHIQTCHYIGTVEEDYVINILTDSTIKIAKYQSSYRDQYNSLVKVEYTGKYYKQGDSIIIQYLNTSHNVNYKDLSAKKTSIGSSKLSLKYPSSIFIISEYSITAATGSFPNLEKSSLEKIAALENFSTYISIKKS